MQNLDKVLDLIKKTGDKAIIMPEFSDQYIIMPIDQYEKFVVAKVNYAEMTEEEILGRVNREISLWKQSQRELGFEPDIDLVDSVDDEFDDNNLEELEDEKDFKTDFNDDHEDLDYEAVPPPPDLHSVEYKNDFLVEPME